MLFELISGFLMPRLMFDAQGNAREPGGKYLTAQQAAEHTGAPLEVIKNLYRSFSDDLSVDRVNPKPLRPLTEDDELRILRHVKFGWLGDDLFDAVRIEAARLGLPLVGRFFHPYVTHNLDKKRQELQIHVTIDGFRLLAERTGNYRGQTKPEWAGGDGQWKDCWPHAEPPKMARVGILKRDGAEPIWGIAHWDSYAPIIAYEHDGTPIVADHWMKMKPEQLLKCAESVGFRRAFPHVFAGVYSTIEMEQAAPNGGRERIDLATGEVRPIPRLPAPQQSQRAKIPDSDFEYDYEFSQV